MNRTLDLLARLLKSAGVTPRTVWTAKPDGESQYAEVSMIVFTAEDFEPAISEAVIMQYRDGGVAIYTYNQADTTQQDAAAIIGPEGMALLEAKHKAQEEQS